MGELKVKEREIVVPGQELAKGMDFLPAGAAFREHENIIASQVGLVSVNGNVVKIIPLSGKYFPKVGDMVIGKVMDMSFNNWFVDIGYAYEAALSLRDVPEYVERSSDLSRYYNFDDMIIAKVTKVTKAMNIDLTMKESGLSKLIGGRFVFITPNKVPRVIGKSGSMVDMIKNATGCRITVGQNGRIWIKGTDPREENLAAMAIMKIEKESHIDGLTGKISKFLQENKVR